MISAGQAWFHYAGISLSGAIGAHLAVHQPERVATLAALVRSEGTGPLPATSPARWFATPATADTPFGRRLLRDLADADPVGLDRVRTGGASGVLPVD